MGRHIQDSRGKRTKSGNSLDLISNMPELAISLILSLMPTRDAVRTSVLSRDWEFKWRSSWNVDIDDKESNRPEKNRTKTAFVDFVGRVVLHTCNITSFRLKMSYTGLFDRDTKRFEDFIGAVLMSNVESLVVHMECYDEFVFPRSLIRNTSLRNLELRCLSFIKIPSRASFPNLRNLHLYDVTIKNDSSSNILTLSLPVLETLELDECSLMNVKMMEVHAPVLAKFHRTFHPEDWIELSNHCSIKIFSERLAEFRLEGVVIEKFILEGQQVVCAALSYNNNLDFQGVDAIGRHAQRLLSRFSNLKELSISGHLTEVIVESAIRVSLPVFRHLVRLSVLEDTYFAEGLLELLHVAPSLKFLSLVCHGSDYDYSAVEHVPISIKDHLEEIGFQEYDDNILPLDLVKFLLENGRALKKVYVSCGCPEIPSDKIAEHLLAFSNSSTDLTIVVE